jgi:phage terminase small subunit
MSLSSKQRAFIEAYIRSWNATQSALAAGYSVDSAYSQGPRLLKNAEIQAEISQRLEELTMSPAEVLARLTEHGRADIGVFFKIVEEWTQYPLPSHEIIDAKEVEEPAEEGKEPKTKTVYWVRHVAIDMDRITDPQYSKLIEKFKDSPKDGISLELHDVQGALKLLGQKHGLFKDKLEVSGTGGGPVELHVVYENKRADTSEAEQ